MQYVVPLEISLVLAILAGCLGGGFVWWLRVSRIEGVLAGLVMGLAAFGFFLWYMNGVHGDTLDARKAYTEVFDFPAYPGLAPIRAERRRGVDTAQSSIELTAEPYVANAFLVTEQLKARERDMPGRSGPGWDPPDWWPQAPCAGMKVYDAGDPLAPGQDRTQSPVMEDFSAIMCPREKKLFIMREEY